MYGLWNMRVRECVDGRACMTWCGEQGKEARSSVVVACSLLGEFRKAQSVSWLWGIRISGFAIYFVAWDGFIRMWVVRVKSQTYRLVRSSVTVAGRVRFLDDFGGESHVAGVDVFMLQYCMLCI